MTSNFDSTPTQQVNALRVPLKRDECRPTVPDAATIAKHIKGMSGKALISLYLASAGSIAS